MNKAIFLVLIFFLNNHFVSSQTITDYNCLKIQTITEYPIFKSHFSYLISNYDSIVFIDNNSALSECIFLTSYRKVFLIVDTIQGKEYMKNENVINIHTTLKEGCYLRIFFIQNITNRTHSRIYVFDEHGNLNYAGFRNYE